MDKLYSKDDTLLAVLFNFGLTLHYPFQSVPITEIKGISTGNHE